MSAKSFQSATVRPRISCIVTAYNEGDIARVALESLLAQSFDDFEIVVVDDGASEETRSVLRAYDDERIVHVRQANDGLSSARNRGIGNARGEYLCFLDADDLRPQWAFQELATVIEETGADCIFSPGMLVERKSRAVPFYDTPVFGEIYEKFDSPYATSEGESAFEDYLALLALLEPQVANKCVRREIVTERHIHFPNGLYFEDFLFHIGLLCQARSFAVTRKPAFTYFQRYGRPQITSTSDTRRFDAISVARIALDAFARSPRYAQKRLRTGLLFAILRLVFWCEKEVSHLWKWQFKTSVDFLISSLDPSYFDAIDDPSMHDLLVNLPNGKAILAETRQRYKRVVQTYASHSALPSERELPQASQQDSNDRTWVIANLNLEIQRNRVRWSIGRKRFLPLKLDASWQQILEMATAMKVTVPVPDDFDDDEYLAQNDDVAVAVGQGWFQSGYEHYIQHGRSENRIRPPRKLSSFPG